jgi:Uma2 family endonuclease
MTDLALQQSVKIWDRRGKEMINGKVVTMAPAGISHQRVGLRVQRIFDRYLDGKSCEVFYDVYIYLPGENKVAPDIMVVCDKSIVKENSIHGTPDLIAEVLSPGTAARDRGEKKDLYEKHGVKEYWIVDAKNRFIEVYLLDNGKYRLDNTYVAYEEFDLWEMTEEEKAVIITEFKTSLFDDLVISVKEIFRDVME